MDPIEMEILRQNELLRMLQERTLMEALRNRYLVIDPAEISESEEDVLDPEVQTWEKTILTHEESRPKHLIPTYTSGFE